MPYSLGFGIVILRSGHNPAEDPVFTEEFLGDGALSDMRVRRRIIEHDILFRTFGAFQIGMIVRVMLRAAVAMAVAIVVEKLGVRVSRFEFEESPRRTIAKEDGAAEEGVGQTKSERDSQEKGKEKSRVQSILKCHLVREEEKRFDLIGMRTNQSME